MHRPVIRVLLEDDFAPWRRYVQSALRENPPLQLIGEASDGVEALQRVRELRPELILLDINLPMLNGIEAARQIRALSPTTKLLFVSENRLADIAEEALQAGGSGYVVKHHAAKELLPAIAAVLQGKRFVSADLNGRREVA